MVDSCRVERPRSIVSDYRRLLLLAAILAGSFVRFYIAVTQNPAEHIWSDPARHWRNAATLLTRNPLSAIDPLSYQIWLMIVAKLINGSQKAWGLYAGLLSVLTPWLWYRFLRELLPANLLPLIGYAIFCWLPSWLGIFSYFMTETLVLPLLGLSLWLTWRCLRKSTLESFVWATVAWLWMLMTKQSLVPIAVVALICLCIGNKEWSRRTAIAGVMSILVLIPAGLRTQKILGVWAPLGYGKLNQIYMDSGNTSIEVRFMRSGQAVGLWRFLSPSMGTQPLAPFSEWKSQREGMCRFTIDINNGPHDWETALEEQQPSLTARIEHQWENVIFLLWGTSWPDNNPSDLWDRAANALRWVWAPLLVLVSIGNVVVFWRLKKWRLLPALTMLGWLFLCAAPLGVGEGRYRKPFEGLLIANALWLKARMPISRR
jgi:hypothetical protein